MSISGFELTDFSISIVWSDRLSLPVEEFRSGFDQTDLQFVSGMDSEPTFVYENENVNITYDISDATVQIDPFGIEHFDQAVNLATELLEQWSTTQSVNAYRISGDALLKIDSDEADDPNVGELIQQKVPGPKMIENLSAPGANSVTWRYSNHHRDEVDPVIDVKVEPYMENPAYFYVTLRKSSTKREEVWSTSQNLKTTLESLIGVFLEGGDGNGE